MYKKGKTEMGLQVGWPTDVSNLFLKMSIVLKSDLPLATISHFTIHNHRSGQQRPLNTDTLAEDS